MGCYCIKELVLPVLAIILSKLILKSHFGRTSIML